MKQFATYCDEASSTQFGHPWAGSSLLRVWKRWLYKEQSAKGVMEMCKPFQVKGPRLLEGGSGARDAESAKGGELFDAHKAL